MLAHPRGARRRRGAPHDDVPPARAAAGRRRRESTRPAPRGGATGARSRASARAFADVDVARRVLSLRRLRPTRASRGAPCCAAPVSGEAAVRAGLSAYRKAAARAGLRGAQGRPRPAERRAPPFQAHGEGPPEGRLVASRRGNEGRRPRPERRTGEGLAALHARRQRAHVPGLLRAARGARDDRGLPDERAARLREHADESCSPTTGRRACSARLGRVADAPPRAVPHYKAGRRPMPDLLQQQRPYFKPLVEAFGYENLSVEGHEADDVIGTLSRLADEAAIPTCVVSTDRDAFQLVSENVCLMMTPRGVADVLVYTPEPRQRLGVVHTLVPDLIGLKGDNSDNIPGVPGIGDKTAAELCAFGSPRASTAPRQRWRRRAPETSARTRDAFKSKFGTIDRGIDELRASTWRKSFATRRTLRGSRTPSAASSSGRCSPASTSSRPAPVGAPARPSTPSMPWRSVSLARARCGHPHAPRRRARAGRLAVATTVGGCSPPTGEPEPVGRGARRRAARRRARRKGLPHATRSGRPRAGVRHQVAAYLIEPGTQRLRLADLAAEVAALGIAVEAAEDETAVRAAAARRARAPAEGARRAPRGAQPDPAPARRRAAARARCSPRWSAASRIDVERLGEIAARIRSGPTGSGAAGARRRRVHDRLAQAAGRGAVRAARAARRSARARPAGRPTQACSRCSRASTRSSPIIERVARAHEAREDLPRRAAGPRRPRTAASTRRSTRRRGDRPAVVDRTRTSRTSRCARRSAARSARRSSPADGRRLMLRRLQPGRAADPRALLAASRRWSRLPPRRGRPPRDGRRGVRQARGGARPAPSATARRRSTSASSTASARSASSDQLGIPREEAQAYIDTYLAQVPARARASSTRRSPTARSDGYVDDAARPPPADAGAPRPQPPAAHPRRAARRQHRHPGLGRRHHQGRDGPLPPRTARRGPPCEARAADPRRAPVEVPDGETESSRAIVREAMPPPTPRPAARGRRRRSGRPGPRRRVIGAQLRAITGNPGALANGVRWPTARTP